MIEVLGPLMIRAGQRRYLELGLDEGAFARALPALEEVVASRGPSTRDEIVEALARRGLKAPGPARTPPLRPAAVRGPDRPRADRRPRGNLRPVARVARRAAPEHPARPRSGAGGASATVRRLARPSHADRLRGVVRAASVGRERGLALDRR